MDLYKVVYENEEDGDVYGISIVDDPANGSLYMALAEQKPVMLKMADEKKKILTGVVLIPEQKIYREFEDGTPFQLMFDASTIEKISQDFLRKGYQKNTTFNHDGNNWLNGTSLVESWIVENPEQDKLTALGFKNVVKGTWAVSMKLSDELWNEYIETGLAKGFSIDSMIRFEKVNLNNKVNMAIPPYHDNCKCQLVDGEIITNGETCDYCLEQVNKTELSRENNKQENMSMLKKLIKLFSEEAVSLASLETAELGTLTADAFEVGNIVYDANLAPVIATSFTADNKVYQTDDTGAIIEVSDVTEELGPEELKKDKEVSMEDVAPEVVTEVSTVTEDIVAEIAKPVEEVDVEALKEKIAILTAELEKLTKQQEEVMMENVELKNKAVSTKLKAEVKEKVSPITMKAKEVSADSTLEALSRITKKINK